MMGLLSSALALALALLQRGMPFAQAAAGAAAAAGNMRAVQANGYVNTPANFSSLSVRRVPLPATPLPPMSVLVRVVGSSVNPVDWKLVEFPILPLRFPTTLGMDMAGVVSAVGSDVKTLKPGMRVWADLDCPSGKLGAYADYVSVTESCLGIVPEELSLHEAATLPLVSMTGLAAFQSEGHTGAPWPASKNTVVVVLGASGGCGASGVEMALAFGAKKVFGTTLGAMNLPFVRSLGAGVVAIDAAVTKDWVSAVGGADSVDVVYDTVGVSGTADLAMKALRKGGAFVTIAGALSKAPKPGVTQTAVHHWQKGSRALDQVAALVKSGHLRPHIQRTFPLEDTVAAFTLSAKGGVVGKLAINVSAESAALKRDNVAGRGRPMPLWPYAAPKGHGGTPGIAWFGANSSGFENEHQLSLVFPNYSMVVFGWQALLTAPANYTRELSLLVEQCQTVKESLKAQGHPDTPVIVYCDNLRVQPFYGALRKIMRDPLYEDFFLRAPGQPTSQEAAGYIPANTYCAQMGQSKYDPKCLCWYWNLFNESAVDYYLNELLLPQLKKPNFDGVFFDGSDGFMRGTWKQATNVPAGRTDSDALQAVISFHKKGAELLGAHGKYAIYSEHLADTTPVQQRVYSKQMEKTGFMRFYEGFAASEAYVDMILNETQPAAGGFSPLPVVVHASSRDDSSLNDTFAAFLIIRSDYSYFMASMGWHDAGWAWHSQYDRLVGDPLGPAHKRVVGSGAVYTRKYTNCDVTLDCSANVTTRASISPSGAWDCKLVNCSCQDFATFYGTHPGKGFGCAPVAAQHWWVHERCGTSAGAERCCGGPACELAGHAPCICPDGPGPWPSPPPPPLPCKGTIKMRGAE